jgi:hypothetical protein
MTSRQIRRAEERRQRKLARKSEASLPQQPSEAQVETPEPLLENPAPPLEFPEPKKSVVSEARLAANRANGRGRDAGCPTPPAQIRTGGIPAYGSYLG